MWLAVDKSGQEWVYDQEPTRDTKTWDVVGSTKMVRLPAGTIAKIHGIHLTWDNPAVYVPLSSREIEEHVTIFLRNLFNTMCMDRPSNYDELFKYICADVRETADPVLFTEGDMTIAFRRFIESKSDD